jgi:hypothetical protein
VKIKISYKPDEEKEATAAVVAFLRLHPGSIVRKSDRHDPFRHIYIATQRTEKPCKSGEDVV